MVNAQEPPKFDSLCSCIEGYYRSLTAAQIVEFKDEKKGRWMNYLPSPGYSPFAGKFTVQFNILAPLQEIKLKRQSAFKIESITRSNALEASQLRSEVFQDLKALEISIQEFHSGDSLADLKLRAFNLSKTQYERNQITPSEFLSREMEIQSFQLSRVAIRNRISLAVMQLFIKSKCDVDSTTPHL